MKPRYYDIQSIKQQPISAYLKSCGIVPAKEYTHYALYHAPYRNDHNASLKVDFRQNLWHDYGIGKGGSIIDLAVASPYLRHIHYTVGGREYAAIGFPNRSGGYELRDNRNFKGSIAPKDISLINGESEGTPCLFEGFIDFLSLLTMKGKEIAPCLILNSVSNLHKAVSYLQEVKICSVKAFFDNDEAGRQAVRELRTTGIEVEDMSRLLYPNHKDLNEYHVAQSKQQQEVQQVKPAIAKRRIR